MRSGRGLIRRTAIASGLLVLIVGGAFAVLLTTIDDLRSTTKLSRNSQEVLVAADSLGRSVLDLETGARGFLITDQDRFLEPWYVGLAAFPEESRDLVRLASVPAQQQLARQIVQAVKEYVNNYSVPLVAAARRGDPSARSDATTLAGKRRVDAIRGQFDRLIATERALGAARQDRSITTARRAVLIATAGLAGSVVLIVLFSGYLIRAIVVPVRRAAVMAGRLAGGDLAVRMPDTGSMEIGALERAFNTMAGSLEESRDELRLLADEQAALRRVATLVARRVASSEVFNAVAVEVGRLFAADTTWLFQCESDGTSTIVAVHGDIPERVARIGQRLDFPEDSLVARVTRTGRAGRRDDPAEGSHDVAARAAELGIRSGIAAPIVVEGRVWGAMLLARRLTEPAPLGAEDRLNDFTELVATAIANADSRAQLAASRARVVAAGDESRRRIERDLHDGTQQRLVSLGLELRAAEARVPAELPALKGQIAHAATGLAGAVEDLQEIARGIHPAILSKGGLGPALRTLARRSAVPVKLSLPPDRRLPERAEAASYYVVAEALTNAAKHARASGVRIDLDIDVDVEDNPAIVRLMIRDDGIGGADPGRGSGLVGLRDRVEALGGTLEIASPSGVGTSLRVEIPTEWAGGNRA
ncbi:MAG: Histidine kinase [Solirubrobacterales bacterium]|nr:Histidine kinase [Solirubrobacterales bacterium]